MNALKSLPKHILAALILGAGILLIVLWDPPVTVCGEQVKSFEKDTTEFLVSTGNALSKGTSRMQRLKELCESTNTPGGCYELFRNIESTLDRARTVSLECLPKWGDSSTAAPFLQTSMALLARLAWGATPPASALTKNGWLEPTEISLFCRLQNFYVLVYGDAAWAQYREYVMKSLPGAAKMPRNEIWTRSILSTNCSFYR